MEEQQLPIPTPDLSSEPPLNTPLSITREDVPLLLPINNSNPSPPSTKHAKPPHAASYPFFAVTTNNNHYQHITVPSAPSPSFPLRNQNLSLRPPPPPHTSTASTSDWTRLTSDTAPSMPTRPTTANDIRIDTSASSHIFGPSNSSEGSPLHTRRRSDPLSDNPLPCPGTTLRRRETRHARRWASLAWGGYYSQSPILPTSWWPRLLLTGGTRQPAPSRGAEGERRGGGGGGGGGEAISTPSSVHYEDDEEIKPPPKDLLWLALMVVLPLIFLLLGVGIGVGVYIWFTRLQNNDYVSTFAWECVQRGESIKAAFDDTTGFLQDISSFMAVSPLVNNESIWAFANPTWSGPSKKSKFLNNFGYIYHVYNSDRAAWEAQYAPITELVNGKLVVEPTKADYYAVQYVFPPSITSNGSIGYDTASNPVRLAAMERASATNQPSLSDMVILIYNISADHPTAGVGNGVDLFIPFYGQRTNATIIANEAANPANNSVGFVAGAYDLNMLFSYEIQDQADQAILFQAIDTTTNTTLFQHPVNVTPGMFDTDYTTSYKFPMADRMWEVLCTPPMSGAPGTTIPVVLIVIIIVFFLLTSVLTRNFARQYLQARRRVYLQTARLGKTHNLLQAIQQDSKAILQSIADPIVALDRFGYVVGANEHALTLTGYTGEELQVDDSRMHISQLLIPTSTQSTPSPSAPASRANSLASRKSQQPPPHIAVTMDITDALDPASSVPPTPGSEVPPAEPSFPLRSGMREMFARRKDGVTFEVQANFSEATLKNNHFTQVVSFRDVSLQRRAERDVLEAKMRAEEADRSKSEFLFFLCHEIRNPTHAITNLASMLHQKMAFDSDSAARYDLDCIITSANFMSALVSDILDLTRLTQADLTADLGLKCECFDVAEVLENVKRMVDGRRREETDDDEEDASDDDSNKNNNNSKTDEEEEQQEDEVTCWVDPAATASAAPPVFGDEYRLQQALFKMVDWVSETSTEAKREVRLGAKIVMRHAVKGILVRFEVDDVLPEGTAEGEEDEVVVDAADIFRPYARANTSLGARFHASGFGMALARRIIEVMGGELRARTRRDGERQVSCGADFEVWLPTRESIDLRDGRVHVMRRPGLKGTKSFREGTESRARSEPVFGGESEGDVFRRWSHGHGPHILHPEGKKAASQALGSTEEEGTVAQPTTRPDDGSSIAQRLGFGTPTDERRNSVELKDLGRTSVDSGTELPNPEKTVSSASTAMSQISSPHRTPSPSISLRRSVSPPTPRDRPISSPPVSLSSPLARHSSVSQKGKNRALSSPSRLPGMFPLRVLVVEDNLICQRVTKKMLERNDFVVTVANNGQEAVDIVLAAMREPGPPPPTPAWEEDERSLQPEVVIEGKENGPKEPFACVIMDIMTPLLTGYEATRLLREQGIKMPIIALTANSFTEDMKHAEEVGMDGFLTKPVTEKALVSAIRDEIFKSKNRNE